VSHGKFRNSDFIVAERSRRFIGKLRLRQTDETTVVLDPPVVLNDFDFYKVARALVEDAVKITRADGRTESLVVALDQKNRHHRTLRRAYEHLGFAVLKEKPDGFLETEVFVLAL
jgi:hypothetical protein